MTNTFKKIYRNLFASINSSSFSIHMLCDSFDLFTFFSRLSKTFYLHPIYSDKTTEAIECSQCYKLQMVIEGSRNRRKRQKMFSIDRIAFSKRPARKKCTKHFFIHFLFCSVLFSIEMPHKRRTQSNPKSRFVSFVCR